MEQYKAYFEKQTISPDTHNKLMSLGTAPAQHTHRYSHWLALAACAALILGIGAYTLQNRPAPIPPVVSQVTPDPAETPDTVETVLPTPNQEDADPLQPPEATFVVDSPVAEGNLNFFAMPAIYYQDITNTPQVSASRAWIPGSFVVVLDKAAIQSIFWGPDGIPDTYQTEIGRQDLPWALFWDGYALTANALYDGQGQLVEINLYGDKPGTRSTFALTLSPGHLPFTCIVSPDLETSDAFDVPVTGWRRVYDRDGDGVTDYICGSEFMTEDNVGVRFESRNCGTFADPEDPTLEERDYINAEAWFNTLFVRQALVGGLHLDALMTNEEIPAWEETTFDTLSQALEQSDFAPYLPETAPVSWSEFYGHLSYQEGNQDHLWVRWSKMYDNVEIGVYLPEDPYGYPQSQEPVDVNVPESYDYRLYDGPISDSVPQEYRYGFFRTMFRAQDMSLEVVKARETGHDTGGSSFRFSVLHENGVVVSYSCDRLTAQEVWALVEPTL